ncbi:MAG: acyl carrier protein [Clostridia bacterium]|nr:acyl carrier protein [Candidatus Limimonas egerieequi]MCQ2489389.1 acyl carrier protein [Clostridia bacterium]
MVFETVRAMIAEQLEIDEEEITMDSALIEDLGADSLDVVDLVMSIEDEFEIEVPDEAIENMRTIGDAVKFIEANK